MNTTDFNLIFRCSLVRGGVRWRGNCVLEVKKFCGAPEHSLGIMHICSRLLGMTDKNLRDATPEDFGGLDGVPEFQGSAGGDSTKGIYSMTGKAAPTEVFPNADAPGGFDAAPATETVITNNTVDPVPTTYTEPALAADSEQEGESKVEHAKRGTLDLGLLLLRLTVGLLLILQSIAVFFRLGNSAGIGGLESEFAAQGYAFTDGLAIILPTLQLAAGVFLLLGLLTPVAAMVGITVTGFAVLHSIVVGGIGLNVFEWESATILAAVLFGVVLALQFTGPGLYGVDATRSWARRPLASSWAFAILGLAAAGALWWFGAGVNPLA